MKRVAVNVMGGDFAPENILLGAQQAADLGYKITLVGPSSVIRKQPKHFKKVYTTEAAIGFNVENPARAFRASRDNPVRRGLELVKAGRAGSFVDCGNTGITYAGALATLGRIRGGIKRPAIAVPIPRVEKVHGSREVKETLLLDAGANPEVNSLMLGQFGLMGSVYMHLVNNIAEPKVGILSYGAEKEKATQLISEGYQELDTLANQGKINFIGNVEGQDLFNGRVDVAVTDGASGNLILKSIEGLAKMVVGFNVAAFGTNDQTKEAYSEMHPFFDLLNTAIDPAERGGALLLGVNGVTIVGHGSSSPNAVAHAIARAQQMEESGIIDQFATQFAKVNQSPASPELVAS